MVPDSPQLLNNLAASYALQGRVEESEALARRIMGKHPEYLFARTSVVHRLIDRGECEEALELLKPLAEWDRMHVLDAAALCNAYVHLMIWLGEIDEAGRWLDMLEQLNPEDSNLDRWRPILGRV